MRLTEDHAKAFLGSRGLPVPAGARAASPGEAEALALKLGGRVVVKALVPTGRRGKAGAVRICADPAAASEAATAMIGCDVAGHTVEAVYVEAAVPIARELYLSFAFADRAPVVLASLEGGVDIEETAGRAPSAIARHEIDPLDGLAPWHGVDLWARAGMTGRPLAALGRLASELYAAFVAADGLMLELNPIALDAEGKPHLVGAMLEVDDDALDRQPAFKALAAGLPAKNPREQAVIDANRSHPGGDSRYTELDGDIGLLVAGGGAGLLQHDMILAMGGRPANHSDMSPAPGTAKLEAVLGSILSNPRTRSLLIGYNYLQMAPCDLVIQALVNVVRAKGIDTTRLPIVIRLYGPREAEARALAATLPGTEYLPFGAPLEEGCRRIVARTRELAR
ncbi:MAG: ATP-grasp domain-containing protein [Hyphomicrobiaceae bacterium]